MKDHIDTYKELLDQKGKYDHICMFGAGYAANYWYRFLRDIGYEIDFFSDNNPDLWGKVMIDGIVCISPSELAKYEKSVLCLVSTSALYTDKITKQLKSMGLDVIGLDLHWMNIGEIVERYVGVDAGLPVYEKGELGEYDREVCRDERIAVYTCIVGKYDDLKQPGVIDGQCDYYYLGFDKPEVPGVYQWIDIAPYFEGKTFDNTRINRFCKVHPHLFFRQYRYSIYLDGGFEIRKSIAGLVRRIGSTGIGLYGKALTGDVDTYGQAVSCLIAGITSGDDRSVIIKQMKKYAEAGFPRNYGSANNGVIAREHNNPDCIRIMDTWWNEIRNECRRDELSFFYALWKNGFASEAVGSLGGSFRNSASEVRDLGHNIDIYPKIYSRPKEQRGRAAGRQDGRAGYFE